MYTIIYTGCISLFTIKKEKCDIKLTNKCQLFMFWVQIGSWEENVLATINGDTDSTLFMNIGREGGRVGW